MCVCVCVCVCVCACVSLCLFVSVCTRVYGGSICFIFLVCLCVYMQYVKCAYVTDACHFTASADYKCIGCTRTSRAWK